MAAGALVRHHLYQCASRMCVTKPAQLRSMCRTEAYKATSAGNCWGLATESTCPAECWILVKPPVRSTPGGYNAEEVALKQTI